MDKMKSMFLMITKNGGYVARRLDTETESYVVCFVSSGPEMMMPLDSQVFDSLEKENYLIKCTGLIWIPNADHPDYPDTKRQMEPLLDLMQKNFPVPPVRDISRGVLERFVESLVKHLEEKGAFVFKDLQGGDVVRREVSSFLAAKFRDFHNSHLNHQCVKTEGILDGN